MDFGLQFEARELPSCHACWKLKRAKTGKRGGENKPNQVEGGAKTSFKTPSQINSVLATFRFPDVLARYAPKFHETTEKFSCSGLFEGLGLCGRQDECDDCQTCLATLAHVLVLICAFLLVAPACRSLLQYTGARWPVVLRNI